MKYGLCNVHYAMLLELENGKISYDTPKRIPGGVRINLPQQGDTTVFHADNVAYFVSNTNNGYQGDLEIADVPDYFAEDALQEQLNETDKVLVENALRQGRAFALMFQFEGDVKATRHVLYNCTCARPNVSGATKTNTTEPQTSSLPITAAPLANGNVKARTTVDTPDATYNGWFQSVWQPADTEGV